MMSTGPSIQRASFADLLLGKDLVSTSAPTSLLINPPASAAFDTIGLGGTVDGSGNCTVGPTPGPRWTPYTADTSTVRVGVNTFLSFNLVLQNVPDPSPPNPMNAPCSAGWLPRDAMGNLLFPFPFPWMRRSSDCGQTLDFNKVLPGPFVSTIDVVDGLTLYADPFTKAPDGTQVVYYGGGSKAGDRSSSRSPPKARPPSTLGSRIWVSRSSRVGTRPRRPRRATSSARGRRCS